MTHATLIANAGILLEIDGIRFLIDGLHHSSQYPLQPRSAGDAGSNAAGRGAVS